jgi:hypothetical protein
MKNVFFGLLLLVPIGSCVDGQPQTYGECLVDLGRTGEVTETMVLCREAFPEPQPEPPFYAGEFFYRTNGQQCATIGFATSGEILGGRRGYCGGNSRIECDRGVCWFTCLNYGSSDSSVVSVASDAAQGIGLRPTETSTQFSAFLYRSRATCELDMKAARTANPGP